MKSDLKDVKVGDTLWVKQTVLSTHSPITGKPIETEHFFVTLDGRTFKDLEVEVFCSNPFEKGITREVEEEIIKGFTRWLANDNDDPFDRYLIEYYLDQKYKPLPTKEEAAEKLGITVEQLKEIVK